MEEGMMLARESVEEDTNEYPMKIKNFSAVEEAKESNY
jgi:hypothetical protein